jgi:hypothetical protein
MKKGFGILLTGLMFFGSAGEQITSAEAEEFNLICRTVKNTSQVVPHLFERQIFQNGSSEFYYGDTRQFNASFLNDSQDLRIKYINSDNQLVRHIYSCQRVGASLKYTRCKMSPLDIEYVITFGSLFSDEIKFISHSLNPQWLTTDSASFLYMEAGTCVSG